MDGALGVLLFPDSPKDVDDRFDKDEVEDADGDEGAMEETPESVAGIFIVFDFKSVRAMRELFVTVVVDVVFFEGDDCKDLI